MAHWSCRGSRYKLISGQLLAVILPAGIAENLISKEDVSLLASAYEKLRAVDKIYAIDPKRGTEENVWEAVQIGTWKRYSFLMCDRAAQSATDT